MPCLPISRQWFGGRNSRRSPTNTTSSSMRRVTQAQLAITLAAVLTVFYIRLTLLPRSSPFELFLLLNIFTSVLFKPPAAFAAIASGLIAAAVVMLVEDRVPSRIATTTFAYVVFSGILLLLNF